MFSLQAVVTEETHWRTCLRPWIAGTSPAMTRECAERGIPKSGRQVSKQSDSFHRCRSEVLHFECTEKESRKKCVAGRMHVVQETWCIIGANRVQRSRHNFSPQNLSTPNSRVLTIVTCCVSCLQCRFCFEVGVLHLWRQSKCQTAHKIGARFWL